LDHLKCVANFARLDQRKLALDRVTVAGGGGGGGGTGLALVVLPVLA